MEKDKIPNYNLYLVDYLTVRFRGYEVEHVQALIGMSDVPWQEMEHGHNGYPDGIFHNGVSIYFGASESMGVCLNMSGQGCRAYETNGSNDWLGLFRLINDAPDDVIKITRLDMAFDDHTGVLDMSEMLTDLTCCFFRSRARHWEVRYGTKGTSLYIGSESSNMFVRIYDKAAERGFDPEEVHWLRIEMQMRDVNAKGYIRGLLASSDMSLQFRSVLRNYVCFLKPSEDTNKSRWELAEYWSNFLDNVLPSSCWECPGTEYNLKNLVNAVYGYRNVIGCYLRVFGWDGLKDFLRRYEPNILPLKYRIMLDNLHRPIEPDLVDDGIPLSD